MQRRAGSVVLCLVAALLAVAAPARAQVQPYFLVIADTSFSMSYCPGGTADTSCNGNTNRCGFPSNRIGDAKCALQRIVDGVGGDANFALMQFKHPCDPACANASPNTGSCGAVNSTYNDGQLVATFDDDVREWVDGVGANCQASCDGNDFTRELTASGYTPLARSLERANEYLRGMRGGGFLYRDEAGANVASPLANDDKLSCRPVSVILLTDGDDTCAGSPTADPPNRAGTLNTGNVNSGTLANKAFRTYVIGFGTGGDFNPGVLNNIANRGGTSSFLPAANEAELSAALNQIVADAQPPVEICNDADDDCDDKIDEGIQKYCDKPNNITDLTLCDEPDETNCDGIDDDCDGTIDEGLTNICGACGEVPAEVCDAVDNDCDTKIDEGASTLAPCGTDTGECKAGQLVCVEGVERCEGEIGPSDELCDCKDNDCDGSIDEEAGDSLCGEDMRCAGCQCVPFCKPVQEFGQTCPVGLAPDVQPSGECICVEDNCDADACNAMTLESDGEVSCAPENDLVGSCICRAGACVPRCSGVSCGGDSTCSPRDGDCVENNCRGLGCASGDKCNPSSGECVADPCADANCAATEVCRAGKCEKSCQGVRCPSGQSCKSGSCTEDKCLDVSCDLGQACAPSSGECIDDPCDGQSCERGEICSVSSGACAADPCWNITCPNGQSCLRGQCGTSGPPVDPNGEAGSAAPPTDDKLFAAGGGGGCACSVPGPSTPSRSPNDALSMLLVGLAIVLRLGRRRRKGALASTKSFRAAIWAASLTVCALVLLSGCNVSPLCLTCGDDAGGRKPKPDSSVPGDDGGGPINEAGSGGSDGGDDAGTDAGPPRTDGGTPQCTPKGPETCDGKDEDCDFKVDEDVMPATNTCSQLGVCTGTVPVCVAGEFICRYENDHEAQETLCDGKDNDCDNNTDEGFSGLGDECEVGVGACRVKGTRQCNTAGNGLACVVTETKEPEDEVCNNIDDDCDGSIDEPKSDPGTNPSYVHDDVVKIRNDLWIYKQEASRIDATASAGGIVTKRACSRSGVIPWTNLTYEEARDACEASDMTLCELDDWVEACRGGSQNCGWSYSSNCSTYSASKCNGAGDTGVLEATGESPECKVAFGSAGEVFDMSGNVKEWTVGGDSPEFNPLRGGSYNNTDQALRCDFDFSVAKPNLRLPNVGFRCCSATAP